MPIDERTLCEYLQKLEEHNLFEMNLLQENTQTLEKMERESAETLAARRRKIDELDYNIRGLEGSWQSRQDRLAYYKGMLDSSAQQ